MKSSFGTQPTPRTSQPHAEKGQGLVELALVIPVLVVIVIGVLDLGRMYFTTIIINNAAREGARYLMQHPEDGTITDKCSFYNGPYSGTKCAAMREAEYSTPKVVDLNPDDITIPLCDDDYGGAPDGECDAEEPIRVTVTYAFNPILWPGVFTFQRSVEMLVP